MVENTQAQSLRERAEALEESGGSFWKPEPGDAIGGNLVSVEEGQGLKGTSVVYTIKTEDGEEIPFWGSAVLDGKLKNATPGDVVLVKYFGKKTNDKGTTYKSYAVQVEKQAGFVDDVPL